MFLCDIIRLNKKGRFIQGDLGRCRLWRITQFKRTWKVWYKGSKKSTPYAAEMLTKNILKEAQNYWLKEIWIIFKGIGMAREWVFKAITEIGVIDIAYIKEETGIQFGGCKGERPKRN